MGDEGERKKAELHEAISKLEQELVDSGETLPAQVQEWLRIYLRAGRHALDDGRLTDGWAEVERVRTGLADGGASLLAQFERWDWEQQQAAQREARSAGAGAASATKQGRAGGESTCCLLCWTSASTKCGRR